jgi:hypothetical protein
VLFFAALRPAPVVLEMEPKAFPMLGKHSDTELHPELRTHMVYTG